MYATASAKKRPSLTQHTLLDRKLCDDDISQADAEFVSISEPSERISLSGNYMISLRLSRKELRFLLNAKHRDMPNRLARFLAERE